MSVSRIAPQDSRQFDARPQGYVIQVYKVLWKHPVRFIAKDDRGNIIAEGTVSSARPYAEFLVHADTGFAIINVGEWDMDVAWPAVQSSSNGAVADTVLDQVISDLPWADAYSFRTGVDAITGGCSGQAVAPFSVKEQTSTISEERYRLVQNDSDLRREISASVSGKYNIEGVNVSASASYLNSVQFSDLSTTLIAEFESHTPGYDEADSYAFTDEAKKLLDDPAKFRLAYGDYFIAGGKRSSRFVAVYKCRSSTAKSLDEFKASIGVELPEVFTADGSTKFMQAASKSSIDVSLDLYMEGYKGAAPNGPWTPETILTALAWFKQNAAGVYMSAKLLHYSTVDNAFPRTIPIPAETFVDLRLLYADVWDIRSRYASIPANYQQTLQQKYRAIDYGVQASQQELATNAAQRQKYHALASDLLSDLGAIYDRMDFFFQVKNAIASEPGEDQEQDEQAGKPQNWLYGFSSYSKSKAVVIQQNQMHYADQWTIGYREKTLEFGPNDQCLIVGWQVVSNWGDGSNGSWWKVVDQNLLSSHGAVHVKSDYDRGCDWTVIYYYVDAKDYQF